MDIKIEKMNLSDLENIKDILDIEFDDFWNYNILKEELNCSNSFFIISKYNDEIIGFAGIKVIIDEANIMDIVVKKNHRNQGTGTLLLGNLIKISKELNLNSITLEVNVKNSIAIHLYETFGFKNVGTRKNYYKNCDAIIMTKYLN